LDNAQMIKRFCSRLVAIERRAVLTMECYRLEVSRFLEFLKEKSIPLVSADVTTLSEYLVMRSKTEKIDSRYIAKAIYALGSFSRSAIDEGLVNENPAIILEIPKRKAS